MDYDETDLIQKIAKLVRKRLQYAEGGHDWWHVYRVWQNSKAIARNESVNLFIVELAALLHDIADSKFHDGDEDVGPNLAKEIMEEHTVDQEYQERVLDIIRNISFKKSFEKRSELSAEGKVVQDADRLDAIGAIGIARAFNYGGYRDRAIYDPETEPREYSSIKEYQNSDSSTINHFYEKLLTLKEKMNTKTGKKIAEQRHKFLEEFLIRFCKEWEGEL